MSKEMDSEKDRKRKKDKHRDDNESRYEKKSRRVRSRSRSPEGRREKDCRRKRRHSRSQSPDVPPKQEKQNEGQRDADVKKEGSERKNKETDMLNTRTGGAYIPPARLRMMQAQITDKSSAAYQRLAWEALKKSIHGHINKINVGNIGIIIKELLRENIVRGRGLLSRSVIQAQAASPTFTNVYAALVAAVNSRFPNIGELLLKRLVIQFKRGFKRNDKPICISSASFIAHLVNQRVSHEILALELLTLLVETPTDDSVEVAIAFLKECGQKLTEVSSKGVNAIFEMLRNILHEGQLDKRVQYMIEVMFQVWKDGFKDHPALIEELELVPEEEQFTHLLMLDDATDAQDILNVFKFDEKYEENEQKYKNLCKEILGSDAESGEEGSGSEEGSDESDEGDGDEDEEKKGEVTIIDNTETNLIALRRTIYLTINSSLDFEECAHKLMKMQLKPGQEVELCHMFLDCCAEQRTYEKFYGLLAQRFCNINRIYIGPFEDIFKDSYATAHRLDTNRLRNVSKFFAHLLFTDSISWEVMECVKLNEEDTTSSSRIYIKILFQELAEYMGLKKLNDRLKDQTLQGAFSGIFPRDNPKNTRFSINFFTSIGLGGLTDELREHLKQMPKNVPPPDIKVADTSSDSSSSSSDSSSSSSESEEEGEKSKKKKKDKSKKKKKNNEGGPKTPEPEEHDKPVERWGHDGFYETYGKDARRAEPQRDKDNFVMPNAPRAKPPRRDDDRHRSGDDRGSRDESRYNERRRRERDEEPRPERRQLEREYREVDRRKDRRNEDESGYESRSKSDRERDDVRDRRRDDKRDRERDDVRDRRRDDTRYDKRNGDEEKSSKRDKQNKDGRNKDREKSNDSDDRKSRKRDETNKSKPKKKVSSDSSTSDSSSSSNDSEDDENIKKHKKKIQRSKETDDWDIRRGSSLAKEQYEQEKIDKETKRRNRDRSDSKYKNKSDDWDIRRESSIRRETYDKERNREPEKDWDIRRESSLRRETPIGRYWDNCGTEKTYSEDREAKRKSPERSTARRRD